MKNMKLASVEVEDYKFIKAIFKRNSLRFVSDPVAGLTLAAIRQGNYWRVASSWKCPTDTWNKKRGKYEALKRLYAGEGMLIPADGGAIYDVTDAVGEIVG